MSIKITPDKYPQIIEVYNTEGKTAAYDLMRSCCLLYTSDAADE